MNKTFADFGISVPSGSGAERYTTCPQCSSARKKQNKKKPCLSVNVDKEIWHCHHCGWSGTLKTGAWKSKTPGWQAPEYIKPNYDSSKKLDDKSRAWFHERGITDEVLEEYDITSGKVFMPQDDEWMNCIQYPFYRNGEVINIKYRDGHKHFRMEGMAERIFYGLDDIHDEVTIIVEGEMDKLALAVAGFPNAISVPDGAPAPDSKNYANKFEFLENCKNELAPVKSFIIAVDMDEAGQRLKEELMHRLGQDKCSVVHWPAGCKDANDTLIKHGIEGVIDAMSSAERPTIDGIVRVYDLMEKLESLYDKGLEPGVDIGFPNMEQLYRVALGEWTVITGIPGHGKSEFLDAMLVNLATLHDWGFAIYSPENYPVQQHIAKLIEKKTGKPFRSMTGNLDGWDRMTKEEMREGAAWVNEHFNFLRLTDNTLSIDEILETTKRAIFMYGIKALVIDPWNELEHDYPPNMTETQYISKAISKIRHFARANHIHIFVIAHPGKMRKDEKTNSYGVPTLYDIAGSAHFRNKADNGITVWRNQEKEGTAEGLMEVHVQKIRFKKNGRIGLAKFSYDRASGRIHPANHIGQSA